MSHVNKRFERLFPFRRKLINRLILNIILALIMKIFRYIIKIGIYKIDHILYLLIHAKNLNKTYNKIIKSFKSVYLVKLSISVLIK